MGISAVIITFNEERNIERCLRSLEGVADEIIVVDAFSTDRTRSICEGFTGLRFISQAWLGFGQQKNLGMQAALHDHILSIDADEALDETLRTEINRLSRQGLQGIYECCRLNYYYGKFLRHGDEYPDWKIRLFPKDGARWNEEMVHESLQVRETNPSNRLKGNLLHYSYYKIEDQLRKTNQYSSLAAADYAARGKTFSRSKMLFSPPFTFVKAFIFKGGFLDGTHGFVAAALRAYSSFLKYIKLWEMERSRKSS